MNYNILSYSIYSSITIFVIVWVGHLLFRNGRPFLINVFHGDAVMANAINKILLAGYYLINIGYAVVALKIWKEISSYRQTIEVLGYKIGIIVLILGIMHLFNVMILLEAGKIKKGNNNLPNNKNN